MLTRKHIYDFTKSTEASAKSQINKGTICSLIYNFDQKLRNNEKPSPGLSFTHEHRYDN